LTRHGETDWNKARRIQGRTDIPLNERGRRQAEALAFRLASVRFDAVYTSDIGRVLETTRIVAAAQGREIPVTALPELRECNYGEWEGLTRDEIAERYPGDWQAWVQNGGIGRPTGGEHYTDLIRRAGSLFDRIADEDKTILVSTHMGPVRGMICHALGLDPKNLSSFWLLNGSISRLDCLPGSKPLLMLLNDTCHLDGIA